MNVLSKRKKVRKYVIEHLDVANAIPGTHDDMKAANWANAAEVKAFDPSATYMWGTTVVF
jgi:hypothetical protein